MVVVSDMLRDVGFGVTLWDAAGREQWKSATAQASEKAAETGGEVAVDAEFEELGEEVENGAAGLEDLR